MKGRINIKIESDPPGSGPKPHPLKDKDNLSGTLEGGEMRIREFGAFTWTPTRCKNWSPTRPSNPGRKSSTPLTENEGFPGPGGLESCLPGPDFEGFRAKAEG